MTELERRLLARVEAMTQARIEENVDLRERLDNLTARVNALAEQVETLTALLQRAAQP
jgi:cell division septum initiation protein DivIVA